MDAPLYCEIPTRTFLPFHAEKFQLQIHIDLCNPKHIHCSGAAQKFYGINWWYTSPESPDLNPIKNLCNEP